MVDRGVVITDDICGAQRHADKIVANPTGSIVNGDNDIGSTTHPIAYVAAANAIIAPSKREVRGVVATVVELPNIIGIGCRLRCVVDRVDNIGVPVPILLCRDAAQVAIEHNLMVGVGKQIAAYLAGVVLDEHPLPGPALRSCGEGVFAICGDAAALEDIPPGVRIDFGQTRIGQGIQRGIVGQEGIGLFVDGIDRILGVRHDFRGTEILREIGNRLIIAGVQARRLGLGHGHARRALEPLVGVRQGAGVVHIRLPSHAIGVGIFRVRHELPIGGFHRLGGDPVDHGIARHRSDIGLIRGLVAQKGGNGVVLLGRGLRQIHCQVGVRTRYPWVRPVSGPIDGIIQLIIHPGHKEGAVIQIRQLGAAGQGDCRLALSGVTELFQFNIIHFVGVAHRHLGAAHFGGLGGGDPLDHRGFNKAVHHLLIAGHHRDILGGGGDHRGQHGGGSALHRRAAGERHVAPGQNRHIPRGLQRGGLIQGDAPASEIGANHRPLQGGQIGVRRHPRMHIDGPDGLRQPVHRHAGNGAHQHAAIGSVLVDEAVHLHHIAAQMQQPAARDGSIQPVAAIHHQQRPCGVQQQLGAAGVAGLHQRLGQHAHIRAAQGEDAVGLHLPAHGHVAAVADHGNRVGIQHGLVVGVGVEVADFTAQHDAVFTAQGQAAARAGGEDAPRHALHHAAAKIVIDQRGHDDARLAQIRHGAGQRDFGAAMHLTVEQNQVGAIDRDPPVGVHRLGEAVELNGAVRVDGDGAAAGRAPRAVAAGVGADDAERVHAKRGGRSAAKQIDIHPAGGRQQSAAIHFRAVGVEAGSTHHQLIGDVQRHRGVRGGPLTAARAVGLGPRLEGADDDGALGAERDIAAHAAAHHQRAGVDGDGSARHQIHQRAAVNAGAVLNQLVIGVVPLGAQGQIPGRFDAQLLAHGGFGAVVGQGHIALPHQRHRAGKGHVAVQLQIAVGDQRHVILVGSGGGAGGGHHPLQIQIPLQHQAATGLQPARFGVQQQGSIERANIHHLQRILPRADGGVDHHVIDPG
ncbi:hypothetical protein MAIT1_04517 [Magnetofaba australis IT-1]|uniref:Uncharacterized protein n=1 Tax=Magnetofaba australis IT-1 TaxID=1434232 RepID=A0A1Y2K952_9PROT|nr:hypothetical protein MAIT1_04517 [Magnetofaba australis IT-1]